MNKKWWKYAGIRAIKTFCQTAIASIGTAAVLSEVNWLAVGSASVLAAILSLLTSLAGIPEVENEPYIEPVEDASVITPDILYAEIKKEDIE